MERDTLHRAGDAASVAAHEPQDTQRCPRVRSEQLLQGQRMVEITHNGEVYRLQATRLGKLILTK